MTSSPSKFNEKINLSFAGCGFLGLYHLGVASCFKEYAPQCCAKKIAGASAGALAAMALVCQMELRASTTELLRVAIKARSRALGPFHPSFDVNRIIYEGLTKTLPEDAHKRASGRLNISVTRVSDGKNVILNQFDTRDDLIKAIQCSCFIPFWSGIVPPKYHGVAYMDGGFSDNLPILDEHTITISPFSGESDICPKDDTYNIFQINLVNTSISLSAGNLYRFTRILFPAHPEILSQMCQQGFDDALRFLQRNNKIACTRCIAISFTYAEAEDEGIENDQEMNGNESEYEKSMHQHTYDDCIDCQYRRQIAVLDSLPDGVVQAIQEACDQVNKGIINWLFRHRSMKLLSFLTIPYVLPIDITIVIFCKIWERIPSIKDELKNSLMNLLSFLNSLVSKMESKRHLYSAKFSCQLAMTEFDYSNERAANVFSSAPSSRISVSPIVTPTIRRKVIQSPKATIKLEKAKSFSGRRNLFKDEDIRDIRESHQRKSYAGFEQANKQRRSTSLIDGADRRRSMVDINQAINQPERTISMINFGFTSNRKGKSRDETDYISVDSSESSGENVIDALKNIEELDQANAIEIANKALEWERECLGRYQEFGEHDADVNMMLDVTKKQEALLAYYYTDEKNQVKVTEIFTDAKPLNEEMECDYEDGLLAQLPSTSKGPTPSTSRQRKKSVFLID